jgi:agmatine deiminase
VLYPPLWALHAEMVKAIAPVCGVTITVSRPMWANGIRLYLEQHGVTDWHHIRFLNIPTDDIWVRDYGPFVGLDEKGEQVVVSATFDPLTTYPQMNDNALALRWAAHNEIPAREISLHTEGGNYWSDGAGTLMVSDELLIRHAQLGLSREEVERRLHEAFAFEKLIVTPHLLQEETGHVDMVTKLADAQTVLVTEAEPSINAGNLRRTAEMFRAETNARGQPYTVIELPALPRYFNWGAFSVWRSYTNALTVNGRVLVPVYGEPTDDAALLTYERAMPGYTIIPINCRAGANGGGAVHCMTKEVPRAQSNPK